MDASYSDEFTISGSIQDSFNPNISMSGSIEEVINSLQLPPPRYSTQHQSSNQLTEISDQASVSQQGAIDNQDQSFSKSHNTTNVPKLDLSTVSNPKASSKTPVVQEKSFKLDRSTQYDPLITQDSPNQYFQTEEIHADHIGNIVSVKVEEIDNVEYVNQEVARRVEVLRKKRQDEKDRILEEKRLAKALEALEIIKKEEEELIKSLGLTSQRSDDKKSKQFKLKDFVFYTLC